MSSVIGIVVNPKLKKPVLVVDTDASCEIERLDREGWPAEGNGRLDRYDHMASVIGFPRTHTAAGVRTKGMGYGTCLYTGLVLMADARYEEQGVFSIEHDRSSDADEWWDQAVRLGLASRSTYEREQENYDATDEFRTQLGGEEIDTEWGRGEITYVNDVNVDVTADYDADVYTFESADENELLLARLKVPDFDRIKRDPSQLWRELASEPGEKVVDIEPALILALDVREVPLDTINLLGILCQEAGASDEDVRQLRLRWELGLDPAEPVRQLRLPFQPNSSEYRAAARANARAAELRSQTPWRQLAQLP